MTLLKGEMFDKFTSVLASNTINLTNAFEVVEDQNYTLNVSFSLFEEKNVIQNFTHFGKFTELNISCNYLLLFFRHLWSAVTRCH